MTSSATFSPSSFLSFFDFPVVAATSANASSLSSNSSHSHSHRPSTLFDLSCLQPDVNSPPIVTSPVPAAPPHSHFFPTGGHARSASTSSTLSSSSSSPSLRSSLPSSTSSLSSCSSPKSPPTTASSATPPAFPAASSSSSASSGHGPFAFELSSLTSWLDSLFPAEDNSAAATQPSESKQQIDSAGKGHVQQQQQQAAQELTPATAMQGVGGRRPCRPRLSPSHSPSSSASLVRALSSHPKKPFTLAASSKADVYIAHPASSPMSIVRTSALLSRKPVASTTSTSLPSTLSSTTASSPPSPPVDLDETVASLLAGGDSIVRNGSAGGGALSPLPEVQVVEMLTPDSPSHVLTLDVHRTDELTESAATADEKTSRESIAEQSGSDTTEAVSEQHVPFADFVIAGIPVGQPLSVPPASPPLAALILSRSVHSASPPPPASLLSSALLEADLDYFHVDRETAIAVEQLTSPAPHSPDSTTDDDTADAELTWEEEEEEDDEEHIVRLHDEPRRQGKSGKVEEEDWEVCRVQEGGGGTDDDYELL